MEKREYISKIVDNLKAQGSFDQFRRQCLSDVDTKPSYRSVIQRVEGHVNRFLARQIWSSSLNKAQLRNRLRNDINDYDLLKNSIRHLVDQVVNEDVRNGFKEKIEEKLNEQFGIKKEKIQKKKDLVADEKNKTKNLSEKDSLTNKESVSDKMDFVDNDNNSLEQQKILSANEYSTKNEPISEELESFVKVNQDEMKNNAKDANFSKRSHLDMLTAEQENLINLQKNDFKKDNIEQSYDSDRMSVDMDIDSSDEQIDLPISQPSPIIDHVPNKELNITETHVIEHSETHTTEPLPLSLKEEAHEETKDKYSNAEENQTIKPCDIPSQASNVEMPQEIETQIKEEEISDLSSVHTSDLSDFDDEISIEGSDDDDDTTKKRISLRQYKELAASISDEEKSTTTNLKSESSSDDELEEKSIKSNKRNRNLKLNSDKMSIKINKKSKRLNKDNENDQSKSTKQKKIEQESTQTITSNLKRKRTNSDNKSSKEFGSKNNSKNVIHTVTENKPRRGRPPKNKNIESSQPSPQINTTTTSLTTSKNNQKQNKRYDSSDLYKPRHSLSSTRRNRSTIGPLTPESNSNSTLDDGDLK